MLVIIRDSIYIDIEIIGANNCFYVYQFICEYLNFFTRA